MTELVGPVSLLIVGAGDRGTTYADYALAHPEQGRVVAVAEPDRERRARLAERHNVPESHCFTDWREALARPRLADAVVIATGDRDHAAPAIAFAHAGWDILLEKPMAPTAAQCQAIVEAVKQSKVLFEVCHVLRYAPYTRLIRRLIGQDAIGTVVGVQHLEPVGWWHFAHSYVRGNWRRTDQSAPVLLTKCCHDLDWLSYVFQARCERVASFASLCHFRPESRPKGAATRCVDCPLEPRCAYSAVRLYWGRFSRGERGWPVQVLAQPATSEGVGHALRAGPYGRCVYACDNDAFDQQVVILQFAAGRCATFTMSAFTPAAHRRSVIFGTHGWLAGDGEHLEHHDFRADEIRLLTVEGAARRHGGGDDELMRSFLRATAQRDPTALRCGPDAGLSSHLLVFAAEQARAEGRVIQVPHFP
jgi:predicted dehydrogenase